MNKDLQELKEKIQKLIPEILVDQIPHQVGDEYHCDCFVENIYRDITLEDVLMAYNIQHKGMSLMTLYSNGYMGCDIKTEQCKLELRKPLDEQSPETIKWLNNLINNI